MSEAAAPHEVKPEFIQAVFLKLEELDVELDENPLDFGPRRLNNKVARARKMLSECEQLFMFISGRHQEFKSKARTLRTIIDLEKKNLLTNDPETRSGRSATERDAIATTKLIKETRELAELDSAAEDLETLLSVIKTKRADLRDTQGRIRDQIRLCQEEIGLGGRWGSRPPGGSSAPDLDKAPTVDKKTLRDLQNMFRGIEVSPDTLAEAVGFDDSTDEDDFIASVRGSTAAEFDEEEDLSGEVEISETSDAETEGLFSGGASDDEADSLLDDIKSEPEPEPKVEKKQKDLYSFLDDILT